MTNDLRALSDANFRAVFARRSNLANWFGLAAAALFATALLAGPPWLQPYIRASAGVMVLAFGAIYWTWLRPIGIEAKRRSLNVSAPRTEREAKAWLDELRQDELSLGAAMRRGEASTRAPGVVAGGAAASTQAAARVEPSAAAHAPPNTAAEDTATGMSLGMSTGNPLAGLPAGSVAGGMVGASLRSAADTKEPGGE